MLLPNRNYLKGRALEYKVLKLFTHWPYARRHAASKGIADLVCIRPGTILFIQCKAGKDMKQGREELIKFAATCGPTAVPIWAPCVIRNLKLIDLRHNEDFIPS
jgi:hypothetical protein